jgi:hypothetical protein
MATKSVSTKTKQGPRRKSGVEYLAQHPGWKTKAKSTAPKKDSEVIESLRALIDTSNLVVARWESGDLAGAVNELQNVAGEARESLHRFVKGKDKNKPDISSSPLRQKDSELAVFDAALTASEELLRPLLASYRPRSVAEAFKQHAQIHLVDELSNIVRHGHRNDDPNDPPKEKEKERYVLVTISGGCGDIAIQPGDVDVDILDFDNIKDIGPDDINLSDREWEYLKEHDPEEFARLKG